MAAALLWLCTAAVAVGSQEPELPIREIRGALPGPTVAFVAGVHGGKVAAVKALDILAAQLSPALLHGTVLLVRPANVAGYRAGLAQASPDDGLNLNRVFPGRAEGLPTERLAARMMREVVARADYLIDMHGSDGDEAVGDFAYVARPAISPAVDSAALLLAKSWGARTIVWDDAGPRSLAESRFLQTAAHLSGVPATTVFVPGSAREDSAATDEFLDRAYFVLVDLKVLDRADLDGLLSLRYLVARAAARQSQKQHSGVLPRRSVLTTPRAGTWSSLVVPGNELAPRDLLGTLTDSLGQVDSLRATTRGIVLHQRLPGRVPANTALVIYGVVPDSSHTP
jgi:predicted deacylase